MDLGPHVFPSVKFGYIYLKLVEDERFRDFRFVEPRPLSKKEAQAAHSESYLNDLLTLNRSRALSRSELPLTAPIVEAFFLASGGTVQAAREALGSGRAINIGGGFHHAFADQAEGFCYLNDVAIAIRLLQKEKLIKKALIIDLDVHQGNGTAKIFRWDSNVFTFSMHEEKNYPAIKEKGSLDVALKTGTSDEEYLTLLSQALEHIRRKFKPEIIFYLAGTDVFENDQLGGMKLTYEGMAERDRMVRDFLPEIPMAVVMAGGYALKTEDTVNLHFQTCEVMAGFR